MRARAGARNSALIPGSYPVNSVVRCKKLLDWAASNGPINHDGGLTVVTVTRTEQGYTLNNTPSRGRGPTSAKSHLQYYSPEGNFLRAETVEFNDKVSSLAKEASVDFLRFLNERAPR